MRYKNPVSLEIPGFFNCIPEKVGFWFFCFAIQFLGNYMTLFNYFRFVFHEYTSVKLDDKVSFPLTGLNLVPPSRIQQGTSRPYNLYACVNHFGGEFKNILLN